MNRTGHLIDVPFFVNADDFSNFVSILIDCNGEATAHYNELRGRDERHPVP